MRGHTDIGWLTHSRISMPVLAGSPSGSTDWASISNRPPFFHESRQSGGLFAVSALRAFSPMISNVFRRFAVRCGQGGGRLELHTAASSGFTVPPVGSNSTTLREIAAATTACPARLPCRGLLRRRNCPRSKGEVPGCIWSLRGRRQRKRQRGRCVVPSFIFCVLTPSVTVFPSGPTSRHLNDNSAAGTGRSGSNTRGRSCARRNRDAPRRHDEGLEQLPARDGAGHFLVIGVYRHVQVAVPVEVLLPHPDDRPGDGFERRRDHVFLAHELAASGWHVSGDLPLVFGVHEGLGTDDVRRPAVYVHRDLSPGLNSLPNGLRNAPSGKNEECRRTKNPPAGRAPRFEHIMRRKVVVQPADVVVAVEERSIGTGRAFPRPCSGR